MVIFPYILVQNYFPTLQAIISSLGLNPFSKYEAFMFLVIQELSLQKLLKTTTLDCFLLVIYQRI